MAHHPRFLSYAQNCEDVRLARAFPRGHGFYIDVGAADPVELSVTKSLSERGWHGINIEPQPYYFDRLVADRPRDVNLKICLSDKPGDVTLYESPSHRGFSTVESTIAATWDAKGVSWRRVTVPTLALAEVCERHATEPIDFLKIDVEGHERAVLLGGDFKRYRPVVLVIEATEQNKTTPNHHLWEDVVFHADYLFAAFDGLNRYYVRAEDAALVDAIALPPNVFDDYGPADVWNRVSELEAEVIELQETVRQLNGSLKQELSVVVKSISGRMRKLFRRAA